MNSSIGSTPARGNRRGARRFGGGILLGTALLSALPALADGRSAVRHLHANAARAHVILNLTEQSTQATPTLVRGVYALTDAQGKGAGYINESGTLYGDASGFRVFQADGSPPRTLTPAETAVLRGEVMQAIDYDQLIKVQYGDGGGRRMVMFSALDCGYCKLFEKHFSELGKTNNTTFYVVPLSLRPSQAGGAQVWQDVARIWCDSNNGDAWKRYWASGQLPPARACAIDARAAERSNLALQTILEAVGLPVKGTPTLLREDGVKLKVGDLRSYLKQPAPPTPTAQPVWLVAENGPPQRVDEAAPSPSNKVNLGDMLKKLVK
jgi:hypothetical protein